MLVSIYLQVGHVEVNSSHVVQMFPVCRWCIRRLGFRILLHSSILGIKNGNNLSHLYLPTRTNISKDILCVRWTDCYSSSCLRCPKITRVNASQQICWQSTHRLNQVMYCATFIFHGSLQKSRYMLAVVT